MRSLTRSPWPASLIILTLASFALPLPVPVLGQEARDPIYTMGDWWKYKLQGTITTPGGTITAEATLKMALVAEENVTVGSFTYAAYRFDVSGSGSYGGALVGTFTETGSTYLERFGLAEVKTRVVTQALVGVTVTETIESTSNPPHKYYDFPLSLSKTWTVTVKTNTTTTTVVSGGPPDVTFNSVTETRIYSVDRNENTVVDAGTFETFRVHYSNATFTSDDYYSAQVGNTVKQVMTGPSGSTTLTLTDYSYWPNRSSRSIPHSGRSFDILIRTTITAAAATGPGYDSTSFWFIVSGTDGTTGKANVSIPKQLNNTAIKVFADSTPLTASISQNTTHHHVAFSFTLSQHTIMVTFFSPSIFNSPYFLGGVIAAVAVIALVTSVVLVRRKRAPPVTPAPGPTPTESPPPAPPPGPAPVETPSQSQ